jgi:hypothetical protein
VRVHAFRYMRFRDHRARLGPLVGLQNVNLSQNVNVDQPLSAADARKRAKEIVVVIEFETESELTVITAWRKR